MAGGRPRGSLNKVTAEMRALAQLHAPMALKELARLASNAESEAARVAAIRELLDRGFGKSAQPLTGEGGEGPVAVKDVSDSKRALALMALLEKARASKG